MGARLGVCFILVFLVSGCAGNRAEDQPAQTLEKRAWSQIRGGALLLDVRTPAEFALGHLDGAINISHDKIDARVGELGADKDRQIVVYCRTGRRADIVKARLEALGFTSVLNARSYAAMLDAK